MDKRKGFEGGSESADKLRKVDVEETDGWSVGGWQDDTDGVAYFVEQRLVGWIIGRSGATLREIEQQYQVRIFLDQTNKELGYSQLTIRAAPESFDVGTVKAAAEHINNSLARAAAGSDGSEANAVGPFLLDAPPTWTEPGAQHDEMRIDQQYVGWLLGRSGGVVREIEQSSGCKISINQDTRDHGYSKAQIYGAPEQRAVARQQIEDSIRRAGNNSAPRSLSSHRYSGPIQDTMQVEQKWVGWLLGKGGGVAKEIEQETGTTVQLDQSTKAQGYSTINITGERAQVEQAKSRIVQSLQRVGGAPMAARGGYGHGHGGQRSRDPGEAQIRIDQQWVGWLLGKAGVVMKELEAATGATVKVNQDTKAQGYSIAIITGNPVAVRKAQEAIKDKIRAVSGAPPPSPQAPLDPGFRRPLQSGGTDRGSGVRVGRPGDRGNDGLDGLDPALAAAVEQIAAAAGKPELASKLGGVLKEANVTNTKLPTAPSPATAGREIFASAQAEEFLESQLEQKWVGWLLGGRGKNVREIENETGAKITIDQGTKELGYSLLKLTGSFNAVQQAHKRIEASLALVHPEGNASALAPISGTEASLKAAQGFPTDRDDGGDAGVDGDMEVDQKLVGWILGKQGSVLKEIEAASGARVKVDQATKDLGYSVVKVQGGARECAHARRLIQDKLAQANPSAPS